MQWGWVVPQMKKLKFNLQGGLYTNTKLLRSPFLWSWGGVFFVQVFINQT